MAAAGIPSLPAPRRSRSLFSLGGASHGPIDSRRSTISNHGNSASDVKSASPKRSRHQPSVGVGVRKLEVQLTVVDPPTQRPCSTLIALSLVLRAADSW